MTNRLTGNTRYRIQKSCFSKPMIVLQVEEDRQHMSYECGYVDRWITQVWRDATFEDLQKLNISKSI